MKNENNENEALNKTDVKCRFFAQYLNLRSSIFRQGFTNRDNINPNGIDEHDVLQLKPISKISDKDAEKIMRLENFIDGFLSDDFLKYLIDLKEGHCHKIEVVDYLRSNGYAVPFMEYSVDDLVKMGWAELV